jgi:hypothetical protein
MAAVLLSVLPLLLADAAFGSRKKPVTSAPDPPNRSAGANV